MKNDHRLTLQKGISPVFEQDEAIIAAAGSGEEARQLCWEYSPQVVVLDTRLQDQSGWLTCEKMLRDDPTLKVILFASQPEADGEAFAEFVGPAKLIRQVQGSQAVIDEIVATASPAVG